jgi:hypothetical protein
MLKISDLTYDWKLSDIDKVQKNNLKVFSFFAGAGGSSMGYKTSILPLSNNKTFVSSFSCFIVGYSGYVSPAVFF